VASSRPVATAGAGPVAVGRPERWGPGEVGYALWGAVVSFGLNVARPFTHRRRGARRSR
jgi:hypothetical protein